MTTVSRVVEDQDGKGYGAKIWVPCMPPASWSALQAWHGPAEYKRTLSSYAHAAPLICIARDTAEGVVEEGEDSCGRRNLRIKYAAAAEDRVHLQVALERAARILIAAGAREIHVAHQGVLPLRLTSQPASAEAYAELEQWLQRFHSAGMPVSSVSMGSAHQMGTCRMAACPRFGAAKPTGELWEAPGLFVADTSTFPTASGVNPMYTCASIAYLVSQQVKLNLETVHSDVLETTSSSSVESCSTQSRAPRLQRLRRRLSSSWK